MRTDFYVLIVDALPGASFDDAARDRAFASALATYSKDRPRSRVEDVTATGGHTLPLPTGWMAMASRLLDVEYPVGSFPRLTLAADQYGIYGTPTGEAIGLVDAITAGHNVRLTFTGAHEVTDAVDTVPLEHRHAVAMLAASLLADQEATRHANDTPVSIAGDASDQSLPAREWSYRAKSLRKQYSDAVPAAAGVLPPAGVVVSGVPATERLVPRRLRR
jgi:hypothetical protein